MLSNFPFLLRALGRNRDLLSLLMVFSLFLWSGCSGNNNNANTVPTPPSIEKSRFVKQTKPGVRGREVVVFVHGIFGSGDKTWRNSRATNSWPEIVANDPDLDGFDVFSFAYDSPMIQRSMTLTELGNKLNSDLEIFGILPQRGETNKYDNIVFVTHSMGSIVVRAALTDERKWRDRMPRLLVLLAPPTKGARLAQLGKFLSDNNQLRGTVPIEDNDFVELLLNIIQTSKDRVEVAVGYETKDFEKLGFMIVDRGSSTAYATRVPAVPFSLDHSQIAKPLGPDDILHRWLKLELKKPSERDANKTPPKNVETSPSSDFFEAFNEANRASVEDFSRMRALVDSEEKRLGPLKILRGYRLYAEVWEQRKIRNVGGNVDVQKVRNAKENLQAMIQEFPNDKRINMAYAESLSLLGFHLESGEAYEKFAKQIPKDSSRYPLDFPQAMNDAAGSYLAGASTDNNKERELLLIKARPIFDQVIKDFPQNRQRPLWMENLGGTLLELGKVGEAKEVFVKAMEGHKIPEQVKSHYATALYLSGEVDEARRQCELALAINPGYDLASLIGGFINIETGRFDEGLRILGQMRDASEGAKEACDFMRGWAAISKNNSWTDGKVHFRRALKVSDDQQLDPDIIANAGATVIRDQLSHAAKAYGDIFADRIRKAAPWLTALTSVELSNRKNFLGNLRAYRLETCNMWVSGVRSNEAGVSLTRSLTGPLADVVWSGFIKSGETQKISTVDWQFQLKVDETVPSSGSAKISAMKRRL
jgi:tetratricopeptide (TPR) repeat protein